MMFSLSCHRLRIRICMATELAGYSLWSYFNGLSSNINCERILFLRLSMSETGF
jgi:hypothetical protein